MIAFLGALGLGLIAAGLSACSDETVPLADHIKLPKLKDSTEFDSIAKETDVDDTADLSQHERTELAGDASKGTLYFLRQLHNAPGLSERRQQFIGLYQYRILQFLEEKKIKHVFAEAMTEKLTGAEAGRQMKDAYGAKWDEIFSQYAGELSPTPSDKWKTFAFYLGADALYGLRNPDVVLHPVASVSENQLIVRLIKEGAPKSRRFVYDMRESWATRELLDYINQHPGEDVVLIYGVVHSFCDDFQKAGSDIQIKGIWWEPKSAGIRSYYRLNENELPASCISSVQ